MSLIPGARITSSLLLVLINFFAGGCKSLTSNAALKEDPTSPPERTFNFVVQTKGFIAKIGDNVGAFSQDELTGVGVRVLDSGARRLTNASLIAFAKATDQGFNENPQDGKRETEQFRLWAEAKITVTCSGDTVKDMTMTSQSDAGFEGPLHTLPAVTEPIIQKFEKARFYFLARGRPYPPAETGFQAIRTRDNSTIWYYVYGWIYCSEKADATYDIPDTQKDVGTTEFPSFRLWVSKYETTSGKSTAEYEQKLHIDRPQGLFKELWFLPDPPEFTGAGFYEGGASSGGGGGDFD